MEPKESLPLSADMQSNHHIPAAGCRMVFVALLLVVAGCTQRSPDAADAPATPKQVSTVSLRECLIVNGSWFSSGAAVNGSSNLNDNSLEYRMKTAFGDGGCVLTATQSGGAAKGNHTFVGSQQTNGPPYKWHGNTIRVAPGGSCQAVLDTEVLITLYDAHIEPSEAQITVSSETDGCKNNEKTNYHEWRIYRKNQ